ncbi:MAG: MFS transporter [Gammaproteobacteria bacterium]
MSPQEKRAAASLAAVYFMRMFGLFLILPVFALHAETLEGSTVSLAGLAIGIYGLTQALLQIPFGMLSDRIGRKPVILGGLVLFAIGSVVAAMADHIVMVIVGRAIQGSGAIAAAVLALNADLTLEENRTKAMAMVGMSIGAAFFLSLLLGPPLASSIGIDGIFFLTAAMAVLAMLIVLFIVPTPMNARRHRDAQAIPAELGSVLRNPELLRLDAGIFILHAILTALFVAVPLLFRDQLQLADEEHAKVYLVVLLLSVAAMIPFVIMAERGGRIKPVFTGAVAALGLALFGMSVAHSGLMLVGFWLFCFFTAFNVLEASLPSLVSKVAPADRKGTAMGVYSTMQFLGVFVGGSAGGWFMGQHGATGVFILITLLALLWLVIASGMKPPGRLRSRMVRIGSLTVDMRERLMDQLLAVPGVEEAVILPDEGVAYLKVNPDSLNEGELSEIFAVGS